MILIDSDHLSVILDPRDGRRPALLARLQTATNTIALPIIVVEEQLRAWLADIRRNNDVHVQIAPYGRLASVIAFLRQSFVVEWNRVAADEFKRLRKARVRIGSQGLKIASTALANSALLLTANLRDFEQVPGLRVEDWLR
jgi:tRNA(fMet)-specific endonuclease VapC